MTEHPTTNPHQHSQSIQNVALDNPQKFQEHPDLQNSMLYWYPRLDSAVTDIDAVDTPDTLFVDLERINIYELAHESDEPMSDAELDALAQCPARWDADLVKRAADAIGYPAFLRTDTDSAKHDMAAGSKIRTDSLAEVDDTVDALIRATARSGGLGPRFNCLAVREWIDIDADFEAFGGTPIGPEVRVFVRDGTVECHHFYWPFTNKTADDHDIEGVENVEAALDALKQTTDQAMDDVLHDAAECIGNAFDGYWSVDFALATDGTWAAIDMARGDDSWHPETCQHVHTDPEPTDDDSLDIELDVELDELDDFDT